MRQTRPLQVLYKALRRGGQTRAQARAACRWPLSPQVQAQLALIMQARLRAVYEEHAP